MPRYATHPENLIPPKKGEVRNPHGRPKGTPNTATRMKRLLELIVKKKNPITGKDEEFTGAEMLDMAIFGKALKGDVAAYREIFDRVEGKVTQPVDMEGNLFAQKIEVGVVNVDRPLLSDESQLEKR